MPSQGGWGEYSSELLVGVSRAVLQTLILFQIEISTFSISFSDWPLKSIQ